MISGRLEGLLIDGPADRPIASTLGQTKTLARFRADVASTITLVEEARIRRGLVVCDDAYWAMVGMFALAHAGAETLFPSNALPSTLSELSGGYDDILSDGAVQGAKIVLGLSATIASSIVPMNAEVASVTLFTSGSSGVPKRVVKTVRQLELEAEVLDRLLGQTVGANAQVHSTVGHQHLYGLTFRLCWPLTSGRPFFGRPHQFWEPLLAGLQGGDVLVTTPSHLTRLGGLRPLPPDCRPAAIISGGAPLPDDAVESADAILGCAVREFMGSTEAGVIATRLRKAHQSPLWHPLSGVTVTRLDDGRMHVQSPYLLNADDAVSGDIIEFDEAGGFRLLGRADRIAKIEGIRISLTELDIRMTALLGVAQAAVVVLPGGAPHLGGIVVLDEDGEEELAKHGAFRLGRRLRKDLAQHFAEAALPRRWRFVKQLPVGPIGKTSAADLAALFAQPGGSEGPEV